MKSAELSLESVTTRPFAGPVVVTLLAVAVQYHLTFSIGGSEIRLSSGDLLLPPLVVGLSVAVLLGRVEWPTWRLRGLVPWLIGLTVVMTYAVILGWLYMGQWSAWGLFNKYLGWLVLVGYFGAGALLVAAYGTSIRDAFVSTFVAFAWIVCGVEVADVLLRVTGIAPSGLIDRPDSAFRGLMVNPNAFAFMVVTAICLQAAYVRDRAAWGPAWLYRVGLSLLAIALLHSKSRGSWIGLGVMALYLVWQRRELLREFAIAAAGAAAFVIAINWLPLLVGDNGAAAWFSFASVLETYDGELNRIQLSIDALRLWTDYPIFGAGLGHHLAIQATVTDQPLIIHNTGLWLLTETGLIGAAAFTAFFVAYFAAVRRAFSTDNSFLLAALAVLIAFAAISVTHEPMYQRYFWIIAGMAIVRTSEHG